MQKKGNFFTDNEDIQFQLAKRVDFDALFAGLTDEEREASGCSTAEEYRKMSLSILETIGEICGSTIAPNAQQVEKEPLAIVDGDVPLPPALAENMRALIEFGTAGLGIGPKYGGIGTPFLLDAAASEMISRACPSTHLNICWYGGIGHIVEKFASEELKQLVLPKIAAGEWSGSMCLTEPDTGSDLANLRTYGEKQPDSNTYKIYGSKRFISNGCGQVALVLAMKEKGATGLHNLNMYLCLRKTDGKHNFRVTKLEEKVGLHGSATCELAFDGSDAWLVGEEGKGFQLMLVLMNDARIAVGFQGLGLMEAVHRLAADFASTRKTWGKPIAHHELIAEKLLDLEVETKAVRSLCYQAGLNQSLMYMGERQLKGGKLPEAERAEVEKATLKARKRVRNWTPLIKWYVGEKAVEHARTGLQIHGGYGFTTEYRAEWWVRESLILPLYEGTSQIQALMCLKDTLKDVIRQPKNFINKALGLKVQTLRAHDPLRKKLYRAKQLSSAAVLSILMRLVRANVRISMSDVKPADVMKLVRTASRDLVKMENISPAMLHAERLCEIKAIVALAECLVWDAEADDSRRWIAERFMNKTWPRLNMLKGEIESDDPVIADRLALYAVKDVASMAAAAGGK